jgi:hypothetical protein
MVHMLLGPLGRWEISNGLGDRHFLMFERKFFFRLFWPVIIEQVLTTTIGLVNTMMVSPRGVALPCEIYA